MSHENVVLFSQAANRNADLHKRLNAADATVESWIRIAREAGFEFTAGEFEDVVESTLGRKLTTNNAVREYLVSRSSTELGEEALEQVVGGAVSLHDMTFTRAVDSSSSKVF
jgi:predicted ribosomally synthesized peptide with nif11-like leader